MYYFLLGSYDRIYFQHRIKNNAEEAPFGIPGVINEPENDLRFKSTVESKIVFFGNRLVLL